jgi:hypothetical protein
MKPSTLAAFLILLAGCPQPQIQVPARGVPFTDSLYGTTIVRITDGDEDGYSGPGIQNEYARADFENATRTFSILRGNDGEWYLYLTMASHPYRLDRHLAGLGLGEEPEPRWDPNDYAVFYYLRGTELRCYDFTDDTSGLVHDFRQEYPPASYITTKTEGDASLDRRYWCLMVEDSLYNVLAVVCYDRVLDSIVGTKTAFPDNINWVSMDMSGSHCVIGYESSPAQAFSPDLSTMTQLPPGATGHMDLALDSAGNDVMVFQSNTTDSITMVDLGTGAATPLIPIPFDVNTDIGLHFSGNCAATPGWVLVSTYGAENPPHGQSHSWMDNLLFMLELKEDPRIVKVCQTRCYTGTNPRSNYMAECFASVNRDGSRVLFGSNWGIYSPADYTEAYEALLPNGWNH